MADLTLSFQVFAVRPLCLAEWLLDRRQKKAGVPKDAGTKLEMAQDSSCQP